LNDGLITLKDPPFECFAESELRTMHSNIRDRNFRIFTDRDFIYVFNQERFVKGSEIQTIFKQLGEVDAAHAFYLGKELQKALLALQLGKKYVQEENLHWGYLSK
jgi:dihydropteroate synthase